MSCGTPKSVRTRMGVWGCLGDCRKIGDRHRFRRRNRSQSPIFLFHQDPFPGLGVKLEIAVFGGDHAGDVL